MRWRFSVGTLLEDRGNICMIKAHLPIGCETFERNDANSLTDAIFSVIKHQPEHAQRKSLIRRNSIDYVVKKLESIIEEG